MRHLRYFLAVLALGAGLASTVEAGIVSVTTSTELQNAINTAPDGTIIELAAGTYASPVGGFAISDRGTSFTIRAATGATVILDGGSARDVVRFINSTLAAGGPVTFQDLTFANGSSATEGIAGGVTLQRARATFVNCIFQNNRTTATTTGGGGAEVALGSVAHFVNTTFTGNTAKFFGGGLAVEGEGSEAVIHNSTFLNNKTNLAGHSVVAAGGAIHVANGNTGVVRLQVTNSRFEGNEAGYVGGAIYVLGNWGSDLASPTAEAVVSDSLFLNNKAKKDDSVSFAFPTEGGAFHAEDHARARIYHSRFELNSADTGGAVNLYRADVLVDRSVFRGNKAVGTANSVTGFGGAISAISNDAVDATTNNGATNRRSSILTIRKSLLQGRYSTTTTSGQNGGCLYASGDENRMYGQNSVSAMGSEADNRATVTITDTVFNDCDVVETQDATGRGGAIFVSLTELSLTGSLVMNSDALAGSTAGTNAWGGGIMVLAKSNATITNTTIAKNSAVNFGGGLIGQGATLTIDGSNLVKNTAAGGGAAMFLGPLPGLAGGLSMTGEIRNSTISENSGSITIFEDDRSDITGQGGNYVTYRNNKIRAASGTNVYNSQIAGTFTVSGLNSLVVNRVVGGNTDKAPSNDNTAPASDPVLGQILVVPTEKLSTGAPSETTPIPAYVGYAWGGSAGATLDESAKSGQAVLEDAGNAGTRTLTVSATNFTATLTNGATPSATYVANPTTVNAGVSSQLTWSTPTGTFVTGSFDQARGVAATSSGSANVTPNATTTYRYFAATEQGGAVASATVTVAGALPTLSFTTSHVLVPSGGGTQITLSWTASAGASLSLNGNPVSGPSGSINTSPGGTTTYTMVATNGTGSTTKQVTVTVNDGQVLSLGTPVVTAPTAAQTVIVTGVGFTWNAVASAAGYDLRIFDANTGAVQFSGSLLGGSSTSTLISLPPGSYRFAVRACSAGGFTVGYCGLYGSQAFTVAPAGPSAAPTVTFPTEGALLTSSTQTLQWTAVTPNPALSGLSYEVLLTNVAAGTTTLQITVPSPLLSTIFTMGSSTQYEMKVRACQAGCGPWSTTVTFAVDLPAAPASPPSISSCSVTGNSLTCSWGAVTNADTYQVLVVQPPPAGPGGGALAAAATQVSVLNATIPVPVGDATVLIAACNGDGCGPYASTPISVTGANPSAPTLGTPMGGTVAAGPTVLFTWNRIPGDTGTNTWYRLFVQDLSRQATAFDVFTKQNYYAGYFKAEGARYDALVIANPGLGSQVVGPASGFNVSGTSATSPTMVQPAHDSTVSSGNIQLGWSPVPGATLYEYFVAVQGAPTPSARGVTPGLLTQVPLTGTGAGTIYSGIVRACPAGLVCVSGVDTNWGPWSNVGGPGVTNFTVTNVP